MASGSEALGMGGKGVVRWVWKEWGRGWWRGRKRVERDRKVVVEVPEKMNKRRDWD